MKKTKTQKGITLVALIITIIVLLILAVVTINPIQDDGIISYAENAKEDYIKSQGEEQDMLDYYLGVLESGEVVPTVKELQEQHTFSYYSSLKRAVEKANGDTTKTPDADEDKAVAGIYEEDGKTYVVLMKDTTTSEAIFITANITLNLGGKTLTYSGLDSCIYFGKANASASANLTTEATIDGRIGGSAIECNIADASGAPKSIGIIRAYGKSLIINSGKYSITTGNANSTYAIRIYDGKDTKFEMNNASISISNNATTSSSHTGVLVQSELASINNCSFNINTNVGDSEGIKVTDTKLKLSNTNINASSAKGFVRGLYSTLNGEIEFNNTNIFTDAVNNHPQDNCSAGIDIKGEGIIKIYSGNVEGTYCGLYAADNAQTYIYGGTFSGGKGVGIMINSSTTKTYIENASIMRKEYRGSYEPDAFTAPLKFAIYTRGEVYMDNCNISVKEEGDIAVNVVENETHISNSRITGEVAYAENTKLYLGQNMSKEALGIPQDEARVEEQSISYKGYDKTLMAGN